MSEEIMCCSTCKHWPEWYDDSDPEAAPPSCDLEGERPGFLNLVIIDGKHCEEDNVCDDWERRE